jgi:hypothetical protein
VAEDPALEEAVWPLEPAAKEDRVCSIEILIGSVWSGLEMEWMIWW